MQHTRTHSCTRVLKKKPAKVLLYIESIQRSYIREIIHLSLLNIDMAFRAEHCNRRELNSKLLCYIYIYICFSVLQILISGPQHVFQLNCI